MNKYFNRTIIKHFNCLFNLKKEEANVFSIQIYKFDKIIVIIYINIVIV